MAELPHPDYALPYAEDDARARENRSRVPEPAGQIRGEAYVLGRGKSLNPEVLTAALGMALASSAREDSTARDDGYPK